MEQIKTSQPNSSPRLCDSPNLRNINVPRGSSRPLGAVYRGYCLKIGPSGPRYKDLISIMQMNILVSDHRGVGLAVPLGSLPLLPSQVHWHPKSQSVSTPCTSRLPSLPVLRVAHKKSGPKTFQRPAAPWGPPHWARPSGR